MFGEERESHEMILDVIHPTGVEEWYCPTCGQRFLLQWPPAYKKVFIEVGNLFASHSGEKGEPDLDPAEPVPTGENLSSVEDGAFSEEERRLVPWIKWLKEVNFENRWSSWLAGT